MKKYIKSAEWAKYNANTRGAATSDCVKRALSLALDMSYAEVSKLLIAKMKELHQDAWNYSGVYSNVMRDAGCSPWVYIESNMTLDEFVEKIADPSKTYIVTTGNKPRNPNHLVCVRDGKVWDSWDSRDQFVIEYAESNKANKELHSADDINIEGLRKDVAELAIKTAIAKYLDKKQIQDYSVKIESGVNSFKITVYAEITLGKTDWIDKDRIYTTSVAFPLSPTMTYEEAKDFIEETAKVRGYDRMYAIFGQEKKLQEAEEIRHATKNVGKSLDVLWLSKQEVKFYRSLPGWVRPLIEYLRIDEPGKWINSYVLRIHPLPGDTRHSGQRLIEFEGRQADEIKTMLDRYKETYEIPVEDYSYYDEY